MPITHLNQYRRQIGIYHAKPHKMTDKALRKAICKAQNSHESPRTSRNTRDSRMAALSTVLKIALVASVVSTAISPAGAMYDGQKNTNPRTGSTVPLMGTSGGIFGGGWTCTAWKISKNELVTAKHCVDEYHPWGYVGGSAWSWDYATHKIDHPDKNVDLSILRFENYPLAGFTYCIPMMKQETYNLLTASAEDICGSEGRFIAAGRGRSSEAKKLFTGKFDLFQRGSQKKKTTKIRGVLQQNKRPSIQKGDSGGAVFGCNPLTGEYEYVGLLVNAQLTGDTYTNFLNVALYPELRDWISQNTSPCVSTDGYKLKSDELYQGTHLVDKCKLPTEYYEKARMDVSEICACYDKKAKLPPAKYDCQPKLRSTNTTIEQTVKPKPVISQFDNATKPDSSVSPSNNANTLGALGALAAVSLAAGIGVSFCKKRNETAHLDSVLTNNATDTALEMQAFQVETSV